MFLKINFAVQKLGFDEYRFIRKDDNNMNRVQLFYRKVSVRKEGMKIEWAVGLLYYTFRWLTLGNFAETDVTLLLLFQEPAIPRKHKGKMETGASPIL